MADFVKSFILFYRYAKWWADKKPLHLGNRQQVMTYILRFWGFALVEIVAGCPLSCPG